MVPPQLFKTMIAPHIMLIDFSNVTVHLITELVHCILNYKLTSSVDTYRIKLYTKTSTGGSPCAAMANRSAVITELTVQSNATIISFRTLSHYYGIHHIHYI